MVEKEAMPDVTTGLDLDKLAYAVSMAETGGCKDGTAIKRNNCFGIMSWPSGKRTPKWYNTQQESFEDFKRIWAKSYKRFPDIVLARKWTGNDKPQQWLKNVTYHYNNYKALSKE